MTTAIWSAVFVIFVMMALLSVSAASDMAEARKPVRKDVIYALIFAVAAICLLGRAVGAFADLINRCP